MRDLKTGGKRKKLIPEEWGHKGGESHLGGQIRDRHHKKEGRVAGSWGFRSVGQQCGCLVSDLT